jgi:hypothetical protein
MREISMKGVAKSFFMRRIRDVFLFFFRGNHKFTCDCDEMCCNLLMLTFFGFCLMLNPFEDLINKKPDNKHDSDMAFDCDKIFYI